MSLYDDIISSDEIAEGNGRKHSAWSNSSINMLQNHLAAKKHSNQAFKSRTIPATGSATNFTFTKKNITTTTVTAIPQLSNFSHSSAKRSVLGGEWDTDQEYDPQWPNDYEKIIREQRSKEEEEVKVQKQIIKSEPQFNEPVITTMLGARPLVDAYSDDEEDNEVSKLSKGAAIAPPLSLTSGGSVGAAIPPPPALSGSSNNMTSTNVVSPDTNASTTLNMNVSAVAAKMMARMGYKEGKGLGKQQQGISTALQVEKTSKNGGVIVSSGAPIETEDGFAVPEPLVPINVNQAPVNEEMSEKDEQSITELMRNPTKVIMLRNMVGQGEVDDDLEPEVHEECSKFGEVNSCVIYEVNAGLVNGRKFSAAKRVPDDEAVRIFVEFKRVESAIKALVDLNGRYFGGRVVKGVFFDMDRFKRMDLID